MQSFTETFEGGAHGARIIGQRDFTAGFTLSGLTPNIASSGLCSAWTTGVSFPATFSTTHFLSGSKSAFLPITGGFGSLFLGFTDPTDPTFSTSYNAHAVTVDLYLFFESGHPGSAGITFGAGNGSCSFTWASPGPVGLPPSTVGTFVGVTGSHTPVSLDTWYHYRYSFDGVTTGSAFAWTYPNREELFVGGSGTPIYDSGWVAHPISPATFFNPGTPLNGGRYSTLGGYSFGDPYGIGGAYLDAFGVSFRQPPRVFIDPTTATLDIDEPIHIATANFGPYDDIPSPWAACDTIATVAWIEDPDWVGTSSSTSTTAPYDNGSFSASGIKTMTIRATNSDGDYVEATGTYTVTDDVYHKDFILSSNAMAM